MNLQEIPVVDAHFDMLADVLYLRRQGERNVIHNHFMPGFSAGGVNVVVAAIFIETLFVPHQALEMALEQIECLHQEMKENPGEFRLCRTYQEIEAAMAADEVAILLSLEGAAPINGNLSMLGIFRQLGVRLLGPAWARRNAACDGSTLVDDDMSSAGGLTPFGVELVKEAQHLGMILDVSHLNDKDLFGVELVKEAQHLGMILDVSHLNDKGVIDLFKVCEGPVIASHSDTRVLHPIERNLPDEIIQEIGLRGGVIGVNGVSTICGKDDADATPEFLIQHMEHLKKLAGIDVVGIGMDFFEGMHLFAPVLPPEKMTRNIYDVVKGHGELPMLAELMAKMGWSRTEINAVMGGNFLHVFSTML
jgi:membrane dipeptidase